MDADLFLPTGWNGCRSVLAHRMKWMPICSCPQDEMDADLFLPTGLHDQLDTEHDSPTPEAQPGSRFLRYFSQLEWPPQHSAGSPHHRRREGRRAAKRKRPDGLLWGARASSLCAPVSSLEVSPVLISHTLTSHVSILFPPISMLHVIILSLPISKLHVVILSVQSL